MREVDLNARNLMLRGREGCSVCAVEEARRISSEPRALPRIRGPNNANRIMMRGFSSLFQDIHTMSMHQ
jgi:hypothetical protein